MDYQLELKQVIDYPRCRIYREYIRTLMEDKVIRTTGCSNLFYYIILCSFANFRSSYRRLEGVSYLIGPGEWLRCRFRRSMFEEPATSFASGPAYLADKRYY